MADQFLPGSRARIAPVILQKRDLLIAKSQVALLYKRLRILKVHTDLIKKTLYTEYILIIQRHSKEDKNIPNRNIILNIYYVIFL